MPRLQIELTSARPDGTWTWRVAGARQPKGSVSGGLLPAGAKVGDVLRVEADVELEGTVVTAVLSEPTKRPERARLEILGTAQPFEGVTTSLVAKSARPRREGERGREGRPPGDERGGRRDRPAGAGRPRPQRTEPSERVARPERSARPERTARPERPARPERAARPERPPRPEPAAPSRPKRLVPANTHRASILATLAPEQLPVAEQLLRGGLPGFRRALQEQNARARAEGQAEVKADALLALAEDLLPRLKAAEWRDRAEAAAADLEELSLRDLRSVVAGADAARDDETRLLAKTLREGLERRESKQRQDWVDEIAKSLDDGRVVRALRLSARPPDPRTRFPVELASSLAESAGSALTADTVPDRWITVLEAVLDSPVRRSVKPAGVPEEPAALTAARQASGRVPALAAMLGIDMPPPPGPLRPGTRLGVRRVRRPPPPPPRPPAPSGQA